MRIPKKKVIGAAIESGAMDRINRLVSAAHILTEMADWIMSDAEDAARGAGLMLGDLKHVQTRYSAAHLAYVRIWRELVRGSGMSGQRLDDFMHFTPYVARMLSVDDIVTDPNTGRPVKEDYERLYKPEGGQEDAGAVLQPRHGQNNETL